MNDPNHSPIGDDRLLATLRAATRNGSTGAQAEPGTSHDEPSLRETYAGFAKAMGVLAKPIDAQSIVEAVLGRSVVIEAPSVTDDLPTPAKPTTPETPTATRRRRGARPFWTNPWSYVAVASIVAVAGLTWLENFSSDRSKRVQAGEVAQWNGYAQIDENLDRLTDELELIAHTPDFVSDPRAIDEQIDDAEADMNALLNDMGLIPL